VSSPPPPPLSPPRCHLRRRQPPRLRRRRRHLRCRLRRTLRRHLRRLPPVELNRFVATIVVLFIVTFFAAATSFVVAAVVEDAEGVYGYKLKKNWVSALFVIEGATIFAALSVTRIVASMGMAILGIALISAIGRLGRSRVP